MTKPKRFRKPNNSVLCQTHWRSVAVSNQNRTKIFSYRTGLIKTLQKVVYTQVCNTSIKNHLKTDMKTIFYFACFQSICYTYPPFTNSITT